MTPDQALDKAVSHPNIKTMEGLGVHLGGISKGAVSQWKLPGRQVPAEHCPVIERLTEGEVRCEDLRPDVDWAYVRANGDVLVEGRPIDGAVVRETQVPTRSLKADTRKLRE
jgi:DNA-binding transcriptional regulator YdaS (Cro superfamily)